MVLAMQMMMVHSFQSFVLLTYEQLLCAVMPQCGRTRALDVAPDKVSAVFHQRQWQCCWRQCHSCWWQFVVWIDGEMAKQWKLKVLSFAPPFYGSESSQLTRLPLQSVLRQVLLTDWHRVHLMVRRKMTFWCWASTKLCNCQMLSRCWVHIACVKDVYCMLLRRRFVLQLVARQNCQRLSKCQWHIACVKQCHCNSQQGTKVLVDCLAWCLAPDRSILVFPPSNAVANADAAGKFVISMPSLVASVKGRKFNSQQGAVLLVTLATAKGCLSGCQWHALPSRCIKGHQPQLVDTTGVDCFTSRAVDARLIVFHVFYLPKKRSNRLVLQARSFLSQRCATVVCVSHHHVMTKLPRSCGFHLRAHLLPCFAERKLKSLDKLLRPRRHRAVIDKFALMNQFQVNEHVIISIDGLAWQHVSSIVCWGGKRS